MARPDDRYATVRTSETSFYFKTTILRYIQGGCNIHIHSRDKLKSQITKLSCNNKFPDDKVTANLQNRIPVYQKHLRLSNISAKITGITNQ
jgi:hypothetical protein